MVLLPVITLLPSEATVIKTEAPPLKTLSQSIRKMLQLACMQRQPVKESVKILAHVDKNPFCCCKSIPSMPEFCHSDVRVTWQNLVLNQRKQDWLMMAVG